MYKISFNFWSRWVLLHTNILFDSCFIALRLHVTKWWTQFIARKYCFYLYGKNNVITKSKYFKWVLFDYWRRLSNETAACFVRMNWIEMTRCLVKSWSMRLIIVPNTIDTATNGWINIIVKFFKLLVFTQGYMCVIFRAMEQMIIPSQSTS